MITKLYVDLTNYLNELKNDEQGVTAIEYGLIGVAMALMLIAVLGTGNNDFLGALQDAFEKIGSEINSKNG
ncbi:Flp family type IVb pilin [Vibrio sp. K4]|uniref:Flp family type IVb pilin n=1 Tax=Vibrio sp. K4 TaxID=3391579 RepID=UPI003DA723EB